MKSMQFQVLNYRSPAMYAANNRIARMTTVVGSNYYDEYMRDVFNYTKEQRQQLKQSRKDLAKSNFELLLTAQKSSEDITGNSTEELNKESESANKQAASVCIFI